MVSYVILSFLIMESDLFDVSDHFRQNKFIVSLDKAQF